MRTRIPLALSPMLALALAGEARSQEPPASGAVFPSEVEIVNVDVVVLDGQGQPVEGLTRADFTVEEDGRPQKITSFETLTLTEPRFEPQGRQRVSTNMAPPPPSASSFIVVFDDANLSQYTTPRARDAVVGFLQRALRPGDQVMIVPTSGGAWWTGQVPEDRDGLVEFVSRLEGTRRPDTTAGRIWDYESMIIAYDRDPQILGQVARRYFENNLIAEAYPTDPEVARDLEVTPGLPMIRVKAREVYREATERLRLTLDVLERVSASLAELKGRKTLFLVSDGFIMDPNQREFRDLLRTARNTNTAVHFVDARGPMGALGQPGMPGGDADLGRAVETRDTTTVLGLATLEQQGARSVAIDTGGSVLTGAQLVEGMARVVAESRAYYLLGYASTNTRRDGKFRTIKVAVARPDVTIRARRGYYAPSDEEKRPPGPDEVDPAVRAGLDAPFAQEGIPLRLTSFVLGPQAEGKVQMALVAEVDLRPLGIKPEDGQYSVALDSYVVVHGRDTREISSKETLVEAAIPSAMFPNVERTGLPIRRELSLLPGRYQARLLVRDRASGRLGSVLHEFEVAAGNSLRLSTPILTDSVQPGGNGQPPRPIPIARRTFRPGSRIVCAFEIYGAATEAGDGGPRVTVQYRLLGPDGRERGASPSQLVPPAAGGRLSKIIVVPIPEDMNGDYEILLTVRDHVASTVLESSEPFQVSGDETKGDRSRRGP